MNTPTQNEQTLCYTLYQRENQGKRMLLRKKLCILFKNPLTPQWYSHLSSELPMYLLHEPVLDQQ